MLCTVIWDIYRDDERRNIWMALQDLLPEHSPDWSRKGVYAYWDPENRELLYVGLATNLPERFAQHNGLVAHSGGNKLNAIEGWFAAHERLGFTLLLQAAAVEVLDTLYQLSPYLGAESAGITRIAEGQLIELHRLERGHRPPWNSVGGSARGARWATTSGRSVIRLLSAADSSLFVARRALRDLAADDRARRLETLVHTARMRALMESHQMDDYDLDPKAIMEKIQRFLMLRDGKLIDDLNSTDEQIRDWVRRLSNEATQAADREQILQQIDELASEAAIGSEDYRAIVLMRHHLLNDGGNETAGVALEVVNTGYLEEEPNLSL
jgi:hypothetical protein